jgi:hypothetical protein
MNRATRAGRRWLLPAALGTGVIIAGVVVALLQPSAAGGDLDPNGTGPTGSHALAALLTARGQRISRVSAPPATAAPGSVELVTDADGLASAQLAQAGRFGGDIVFVASDDFDNSTSTAPSGVSAHAPGNVAAALHAIAPKVSYAGSETKAIAQPECSARSAVLAGAVYSDGALLRVSAPGAQSCYPGVGGYALVSYAEGTRTITVLGSSVPLTNAYLSAQGDAALAMNLLGSARQVIWVVPPPGVATGTAASGQQSFLSLVPGPVYLIALQLAVAALLAAAWRARRGGPLVAERLPVTVRATETVEGHGRLYQARRARDRAAAELRAAADARIARLVGSAGPGATEAVAARAGMPPAEVAALLHRLLHGPPPTTDKELVALATELDALERKIKQP